MKKIMIVEDEKNICIELARLLENADYKPIVLDKFDTVIQDVLRYKPDLILLDINLPVKNGELILNELRKKVTIPIIILTSRNSESDEVLSLSYGADDYITKPYNPNILLLRIEAVLKRSVTISTVNYRDLIINLQKGLLVRQGQEVILTKNEMIIFDYLLTHQNKIVERDELMTDLWNNNEYINDNALTVNISRLRAKLKELGLSDVIETRKGQGYILR